MASSRRCDAATRTSPPYALHNYRFVLAAIGKPLVFTWFFEIFFFVETNHVICRLLGETNRASRNNDSVSPDSIFIFLSYRNRC